MKENREMWWVDMVLMNEYDGGCSTIDRDFIHRESMVEEIG